MMERVTPSSRSLTKDVLNLVMPVKVGFLAAGRVVVNSPKYRFTTRIALLDSYCGLGRIGHFRASRDVLVKDFLKFLRPDRL
jgi:hypothetical protein